jgi:hypothetical protein
MRRLLSLVVLAVFSLVAISGCGFVADGPFGWVYTNSKTPIAIGTAKVGEKVGKACIHSFFGAVSVGDASIDSAKRKAGITDVYTVDRENLSIFGTYTRQCTVVSGV